MENEKIQTGLRIPSARYNELKDMADQSGISVNTAILFLVEIGLTAINRGIEEAARSDFRNPQCTDG